MTPQQIQRFFLTLAAEWPHAARVILTGAAAGSLLGRVRPSVDVDFAVRLSRRTPKAWSAFEVAVARTTAITGVHTNYAEDIDRWGVISLLDYARHTRPYRAFGKLEVLLLDPAYWSIGKLSRYLDPDVRDLVAVLHRQRVPVDRLIRLWAAALRKSPRSLASTQFVQQVEHFLRVHGRTIWGRTFDAEAAVRRFASACRPKVAGSREVV